MIGAGCSRNYSEGITDVPDLVSPLDFDFFKMAKKVIAHKGLETDLSFSVDYLLWDLCEMYGFPLERAPDEFPNVKNEKYLALFDDPRLGLENVMTVLSLKSDIFMKPLLMFGYHEQGDSRHDQLGALVELVAVTITEALRGPTCNKHRKLANLMNPGDIVFSYNYDILMDNALRECRKLTDKGYLLDFYRVSNNAEWEEPQTDASQISILKLHGSMNWIRCSYCGSVFLLRRQKAGEWDTSIPNACPRCKQTKYYLERLLIPPLLNKNYTDREMNYLWLEAQRSLGKIREIVIIGYSLPLTDFASETLLRTGTFWETRKNLPVTIVDPDPKKEVKRRFSRIFNPDKIQMKASLDEYLESV